MKIIKLNQDCMIQSFSKNFLTELRFSLVIYLFVCLVVCLSVSCLYQRTSRYLVIY